jgi:glycosyltransferase involved in cell wall biosynthesis
MLPVYEPDALLLAALESVLAQRPQIGQDCFQIAIVDDSSQRVNVADLLRRLGDPAAIELHRNEVNLGLAGNWNRCIELARAPLVHLLHQDDLIRPGFYERLLAGLERAPQAGMAFCRHGFIDGAGVLTDVSHRERLTPGLLRNWLPRISRETRIQTPAAVVRRSVYERLGGFRNDLKYALDWEMWTRIALHYEVWYEPAVLADYRRHATNETARLRASGAADDDALKAIEVVGSILPSEQRAKLTNGAYVAYARRRLKRTSKQIAQRQIDQARLSLHFGKLALARIPPSTLRQYYEWKAKRLDRRLNGHA